MKIYMHHGRQCAYVSRGNLIDACHDAGFRHPQDLITEYELKCSPEEESDMLARIKACREADDGLGFDKPDLYVSIYSDRPFDAMFEVPPKGTVFSLTEGEGNKVLLNLLTLPSASKDGIIRCSMIFKNERGYYVKEVVDPNYDGHGSKYLFLDRSYHGPVLEHMPVDIKVTADKGNYGFFIPQYPDWSYKNLPAILDYLWERDIEFSMKIRKIESPVLGTFYVWTDPKNSYSFEDVFKEGSIGKATSTLNINLDYTSVNDHVRDCCVWEKTFGELLLEDKFLDVWGLEEGSVVDAMETQFHHCKFLRERRNSNVGVSSLDLFRKYYPREAATILGSYWKRDEEKRFGVPYLDEAIVEGAIVPYECVPGGTIAFGFEPEQFTAFVYTDRDEFFRLVSYVSEFNKHAEEDIQNKLRAGKLKLS